MFSTELWGDHGFDKQSEAKDKMIKKKLTKYVLEYV